MRKIIDSLSRCLEKKISYLVEEVGIIYHILFFIGVVLSCGIFYYILTPGSHGIGQTDITIFTGIYFSTVTISSLGYGDIHPMGASKVIACIEVLLGLSSIGIMIAKVTSRRLSYRVERLFSSDAQKRLEHFAEEFKKSQRDFAEIMPNFETSRFEEIVNTFQRRCIVFSVYFSDEASQEEFFRIVPASTIKQVGSAVNGAFSELKRIMDSQQAMAIIHNRRISDAIESQKKVCRLVAKYADEDTHSVFQRLEDTCTQLENYFAFPEEPQPDQSFQDLEKPQPPSGVNDE